MGKNDENLAKKRAHKAKATDGEKAHKKQPSFETLGKVVPLQQLLKIVRLDDTDQALFVVTLKMVVRFPIIVWIKGGIWSLPRIP